MSNLEAIEQRHKELGEDIEKLKAEKAKPKGRWKPDAGDYLYADNGFGTIRGYYWDGNRGSKSMYLLGNVYKTEEEAQYEVDRRKAIVAVNDIIDELNDGWEPDWSDPRELKYFATYGYVSECIQASNHTLNSPPMELRYFKINVFAELEKRITQEQINLIWRLK